MRKINPIRLLRIAKKMAIHDLRQLTDSEVSGLLGKDKSTASRTRKGELGVEKTVEAWGKIYGES